VTARPAAVPLSPEAGQPAVPVPAAVEDGGWLVLTYQLPAGRAPLAAATRRKLTTAGAVYLSPACAVAPLSGPAEMTMRRSRAAITKAGGFAVLLTGRPLAGKAQIAAAFNAICDQEYDDIIAGCLDAIAGIEALAADGDLGYQPLWAGDVTLRRLSASFRAVAGKDLFGADKAQEAAAALALYRSVLDEHARRVYSADSQD